jgi:hypothetical protein
MRLSTDVAMVRVPCPHPGDMNQMNQAFVTHCKAAAKLMSRLANIAKLLEQECLRLTPARPPSEGSRQLLVEAFGTIEAIRHAHMPFIEVADPSSAYVMTLSLKNVIGRISEITSLFSEVEKRHGVQRPKTLPKFVPSATTAQA